MSTYTFFKGRGGRSILKFIIMMTVMTMFMACISVTAQAKPKLSTKKITLMSGKTKTVKLKGAKGAVTWVSSNENVATVSKTGKKVKITAVGAGKAKIIARNNGKSYKITVKVNGVKYPGNRVPIGKAVKLKVSGIGKRITWKSSNPGVVSVNKKTGVITANRMGVAKITAKGSKGKATITLNITIDNPVYTAPSNPPTGGSGSSGSSGGTSSGTGSGSGSGTGTSGSGSTYTPPTAPSYPIVSNNPKYHYQITVLNSGTVDGHESVIYNDSKLVGGGGGDAIQRGALLYIKTDAPAPDSLGGGGTWRSPYTFLIDGKYPGLGSGNFLTVYPMANAHYDSNGRAVGGDIVIIKVKTPGVHTIEIVEDVDNSGWDGSNYILKSYTKTGVSIKINYHDYDAEREQWVAETVSKYTSSGMTDRQKAESLRAYFLSDRFHHYQIAFDNGGTGGDSRFISYMNFTPFWVSGIGDCIESNMMFQRTLQKAGVTCKPSGNGSHAYTLVYLDNEWVKMDVSKSNLMMNKEDLIYVN